MFVYIPRTFPLRTDWPKSDSSDDGEPQGELGAEFKFLRCDCKLSFLFRPAAAQHPLWACSQATSRPASLPDLHLSFSLFLYQSKRKKVISSVKPSATIFSLTRSYPIVFTSKTTYHMGEKLSVVKTGDSSRGDDVNPAIFSLSNWKNWLMDLQNPRKMRLNQHKFLVVSCSSSESYLY